MRLLSRLTPLLLAALLIGCAQNPAKSGAFAPAGAGFTVAMPAGAQEETAPNGNHIFSTEVGGSAYLASYADVADRQLTAAQLDTVLDRVGRAIAAKGGKLISMKTINIEGNNARDLRMQLKTGQFMRLRMTVVKARMFQVGVVTAMNNADAPELTRYLDSFHITRR